MSTSTDFSWLREHLLPYVKPVLLGECQFTNLLISAAGTDHIRDIPYGNSINWTLEYSDNDSVVAGDEGDAIGTAGKSYVAEMELGFQIYRGYFSITDETKAYESSPAQFITALKKEKDSCLRAMIKQLNTDILSGSGTSAIFGLTSLLADSGVYAGQTRGTSAWHTPYYNDNTGSLRPLSVDLLEETYWTQYNRMTDKDDDSSLVILCSGNMLHQFDSLSTIADSHIMNMGSATRQIGANPFNYTYRNIPIVPIRSNASTHPLKNKIIFANLNDFYIDFLLYKIQQSDLNGYGQEKIAEDDFGIILKQVPSDNDEDLYQIKTALQLTCENLYRLCSLVDITE
jgi:hypothetical protein